MAEQNAMDRLHGMLLGFGLQQLPKVLQAIQKTQGALPGADGVQGAADGQQGAGIPGLENVNIEQILPLLLPLLAGQGQMQRPQAGPVPGMPRPPAMGGTPPMAPPAMTPPPPTMGRIPTVPRVLPMSAGVSY